ncbi:MAG: hypothetical protein QM751_15400 [Paludibacteraceae bacterium]
MKTHKNTLSVDGLEYKVENNKLEMTGRTTKISEGGMTVEIRLAGVCQLYGDANSDSIGS